MKKLTLIIIVIIAVIALFYFLTHDRSPVGQTPTSSSSENGTFHPDPSNATFTFDDGPVTLSGGQSERAVAPDSAFVEEIDILDKFAYGDLNTDNKTDTALLLSQYGGGSGTFVYVAAFVSGPVTYRGSKVFFLGDRIIPQSIAINNGVITVKYLDREPDEIMSVEPTISVSKQFVYLNGELVER